MNIGNTPEQLGVCSTADAMMIDGKIVTKADYLALVAQVERMKTFIKLSAKKWEGVGEVEPTFWTLLRVANAEPNQCLREIQAEAGKEGWLACWNWISSDNELDLEKKTFEDFANEYSMLIRSKGGVINI